MTKHSTTRETQVQSPSGEDPLEMGMATHSCILAWRIPGTEEPGELHTVHGVAELERTERLNTHRCLQSAGACLIASLCECGHVCVPARAYMHKCIHTWVRRDTISSITVDYVTYSFLPFDTQPHLMGIPTTHLM